MVKIKKVLSCDICGNEMVMDNDDYFSYYGWNRITRSGKEYDLCPEHSAIYINIKSEYDEKLNNFFEGELKVDD